MSFSRIALSAVVSVALLGAAFVAPTSAQAAGFSATVSGHVSAGAGAVVDVSLWDSTHSEVDETTPDATGSYTFPITVAGVYAVSFSDDRDDDAFVTRFYPNVITDDPADPRVVYFDVPDGQTVTIDGTLTTATFAHPITPTIGGKLRFGHTLTVDFGTWAEDPYFDVQWYRGNAQIPDATDDDYEITADDLGKKLFVTVTASAPGYEDLVLSSPAVAVPANTTIVGAKPAITGTAKVGRTLKAIAGKWAPGTVTLHYQWYVGGKPISTATKSRFTLTSKTKGKKVKVAVTGSRVGVGAATTFSKAVVVME